MPNYLLSLGSNTPDASLRLHKAEKWLCSQFDSVKTSGIYTSKPLNGYSPDYSNMVAIVFSQKNVTEINSIAKSYETACGRTPQSKLRGIIEMDIDIVAIDNTILRPEEYTRAYFIRGLALISRK